eukprot:SAG11_NODE_208_length_12354_cov_19.490167_11_plen_74_part_00
MFKRWSLTYERLAKVAVDLAAEDVEVVGGGGAVDYLPVQRLNLLARSRVDLREEVLRSDWIRLDWIGLDWQSD